MTSIAESIELGADLELFRCTSDGLRIVRDAASAHWELGFGPVDGTRPIWGLYRFDGSTRLVRERVLLWQANPTKSELLHWCVRTVDAEIANRLLDTVGIIDDFYDRYFAARPDLGTGAARPTLAQLFINASTAREIVSAQSPLVNGDLS